MINHYTDEKNVQVIIALLKAHNINKVIASPGSANSPLVASLQIDKSFEMYSAVDERSAAYMACGLADESGEPVLLTCTGATASRNYLPGLTEAFYRKLPVLAITSTQAVSRIGHHVPQVIDRSNMPNDVAKLSVTLPIIKDDNDIWECEIKVNNALLELRRNGGGPVHINLSTNSSKSYTTKSLPKFRVINRISYGQTFPSLTNKKIAIFVGSHLMMSDELSNAIDSFCTTNNSVVFCDHTSSYKGKFRLLFSIAAVQKMFSSHELKPDITIHIGEISGDTYSTRMTGKEVWRVSEDGEIRDTFKKIRYVFDMPEILFFKHYSSEITNNHNYLDSCNKVLNSIHERIPELPFSNIWIASQLSNKLPENSTIHFGILNSLRSWNFFEVPQSINSSSNVGGFGIDGCVSSLLGAALHNPNKLYFLIVGDLAFFYDMNSIGNRHLPKNMRILLVNNGKGTEFRLYSHHVEHIGEKANEFIAAEGHYGNKSNDLVKNYAQNLGFEYIKASNKDEFTNRHKDFIEPQVYEKPVLFEVFTNSKDESKALELIINIEENITGKTKEMAKQFLGEKGFSLVKKAIKK